MSKIILTILFVTGLLCRVNVQAQVGDSIAVRSAKDMLTSEENKRNLIPKTSGYGRVSLEQPKLEKQSSNTVKARNKRSCRKRHLKQ